MRLRSDHHVLSLKADIWSLGVTFYQALCCKLPFKGETKKEYKDNVMDPTIEMEPLRFNFTQGSTTEVNFEEEYPDFYRLLPRMLDKDEDT